MAYSERTEVIQQRLEQWTAATVRALSGETSLKVRKQAIVIKDKSTAIAAPYLRLDTSAQQTKYLRGIADSLALRVLYSNNDFHKTQLPSNEIAQLIFELLEQLRVESLAPEHYAGMRNNLRQRFVCWTKQAAASELVENEVGILIFTVLVMAWSRILSEPIPELLEDVIESTRWGLAEDIGPELRRLKHLRGNQNEYAHTALSIAENIARRVSNALPETTQVDKTETENEIENVLSNTGFDLKWLQASERAVTSTPTLFGADGASNSLGAPEYAVFSTQFDQVCHIDQLIRKEQQQKLRVELDLQLKARQCNIPRIARRLATMMATPEPIGWSFNHEEGQIDAKKLSRLITSPTERYLFRQSAIKPQSDGVISFLIDNSGSMTHHSRVVTALIDTLTRACELAQIKTEVLGYTTREWNGGAVLKYWKKANRPEQPGRLNATQHTIYKSANTPWRRSRNAIAGLMRHDLYRESVDGEALEWAVTRLQARPEQNKTLVVISDGSPMDTATVKENNPEYLDRHLSAVAQRIEQRADIKLCAVGVGLDLSAYYPTNMSIPVDRHLSTREFLELCELMDNKNESKL